MTKLSRSSFERAAAFMRRSARPLEHALFEHAVSDAAALPALAALRPFQNADGGFGNGLEADAATPTSGALATSVGLRHLGRLDAGAAHQARVAAVAWLRRNLDAATLTWRVVPEDTDSYPHAPWWTADGLEERFGGFRVNPRAELVAELYRYGAPSDDAWLQALAEDTVVAVEAGLTEMHDLLAAAKLLESPGFPPELRERVRAACEQAAVATVNTDPESWHGYGLQPIQLAPSPSSALHPLFADAIDANLDHLIAGQADDGAWHPAWSWPTYAEAWRDAELAWAGSLTYEALTTLRAYGRIDGVS